MSLYVLICLRFKAVWEVGLTDTTTFHGTQRWGFALLKRSYTLRLLDSYQKQHLASLLTQWNKLWFVATCGFFCVVGFVSLFWGFLILSIRNNMMLKTIQGFLFSPVTSLLYKKSTPETCKSLNLIHPRKTPGQQADVSCQEKNCEVSFNNSFYSFFFCVSMFLFVFLERNRKSLT